MICVVFICCTSDRPCEVDTNVSMESLEDESEDGDIVDGDVEDDEVYTDEEDHDI